MSEPNKEKSNAHPNDKNPHKKSVRKKPEFVNKTTDGGNEPNHGEKWKKFAKSTWGFIGDNNNKAHFSNLVAFFAVIISGILAAYTYRLYKIANDDSITAKTAAKASVNSATISQQTLAEVRDYNAKSLQKQQDIIDKQNEYFNKEHQPYIQIELDSLKPIKDSTYQLTYTISASSERPIEQVYSKYDIASIPFADTAEFLKHPFEEGRHLLMRGKFYLFKDSKKKNGLSFADYKNSVKYWIWTQGRTEAIYFTGKIRYKNYVTDKDRIYAFLIQLGYFNQKLGGYYIVNNNTDVR